MSRCIGALILLLSACGAAYAIDSEGTSNDGGTARAEGGSTRDAGVDGGPSANSSVDATTADRAVPEAGGGTFRLTCPPDCDCPTGATCEFSCGSSCNVNCSLAKVCKTDCNGAELNLKCGGEDTCFYKDCAGLHITGAGSCNCRTF